MNKSTDVRDQVVLVTGGGSGIGAACALLLGAQGWSVAVIDIDPDAAIETSSSITSAGGRATAFPADVTDPESIGDAVSDVLGTFGGMQAAVNSAGIGAANHRLAELPLDVWRRVIDVNLTGTFLSMQAEITAMLGSGGSIVNISSILGSGAQSGTAAYTSSKHGVEGLTKSAAMDYAQEGIRVNCVAPGFIDTALLSAMRTEEERRSIAARHPMDRLGSADEVARVVGFLCSQESTFVTGSCYRVDGGYLTPGGWA